METPIPSHGLACKSDNIFEIEDLLSSKMQDVHGRRLQFFRNKSFYITEEIKTHLSYQENKLLVVQDFLRKHENSIEVITNWKGYDSSENSWVNVDIMKEDVHEMFTDFIKDLQINGTRKQRNLATAFGF